MKLESNIAGVIDRLERLKRSVPVAVERAVAPANWLDEARAIAERTLLAIAQPKERVFIADFVRTITAEVFEGGFALRMKSPFPPMQTLGQMQALGQAVDPRDLYQNLFLGQLQEFEELLTEWVATEKDKGRKDAGKTDEEIARFISMALIGPEDLIVRSGKNKGRLVRDVFAPHIAAFLAKKQISNRLSDATVNDWLRLVLAAWRQLVKSQFAPKLRAELGKASGELI